MIEQRQHRLALVVTSHLLEDKTPLVMRLPAPSNLQFDLSTQHQVIISPKAFAIMAGITPSAYLGLLKSGDYSDLTITCQGTDFKVHRAVVCSGSTMIRAACNSDFEARYGTENTNIKG